jgi:hypothetical protein
MSTRSWVTLNVALASEWSCTVIVKVSRQNSSIEKAASGPGCLSQRQAIGPCTKLRLDLPVAPEYKIDRHRTFRSRFRTQVAQSPDHIGAVAFTSDIEIECSL